MKATNLLLHAAAMTAVLSMMFASFQAAADAAGKVEPKNEPPPPPKTLGRIWVFPPPPTVFDVGSMATFSGGGGRRLADFISVNTAAANDTGQDKSGGCESGNVKSDPIEISHGAKVETQTLFALPGEMGLRYELYFRSVRPARTSSYGADSFSYSLDLLCLGQVDGICRFVTFTRPDGSRIRFSGKPSVYGNFPEVGGGGLATLTHNTDGTWTLHDEDATTQRYNSNGGLTSIKDASGVGWTIARTAGNPSTVTVTHTNGQVVTVRSTLQGSGANLTIVSTVTDPAGNVYSVVRNPEAEPLSITYPGSPPTVITYKYDSSGKRLIEIDYNGTPYASTTYDSGHRANGNRLADGSEATSILYSFPAGGGMTATITNPLGHQTVNQYISARDAAGNAYYQLVSVSEDAVSDCGATIHTRAYDVNGNLARTVDNNGISHTYSYAANGQLQTDTEAYGTSIARKSDYVWDTNQQLNRLLSIAVAGESKTSYTYNVQNRLASVKRTNLASVGTLNQSLTTTYAYALYANGTVKTMTVTAPSPGGAAKVTYQYDTRGNVTSITDGLGHATTYTTYNGLGEPGHVTGPNGDVTDYSWDARGRMATKTMHPNSVAATWTYAYDGYGLLSKVTEPDGEITTWTRNAVMRVTSITHNDKDGTSTESFGYDANGDVTSDVVKRGTDVGLSKTFVYDGLGRVYQAKGANGQKLTYAYDGNGNVLSVTDALGHQTTYAYDGLNRMEGEMDAVGGVTSYTYDKGDHVTRVTDPRGLVTTYSYDGFGQLWKQVSPDTGTTTFVHDTYGRLSSKTPNSGIKINFAYDGLNRLTSETAGGVTRSFTWDTCTNGKGRLCSAVHVNDDTVSYSYTREGHIASRNFSFVSGVSYALGYAYDNMGQLASVTYPDGNQALYDYTRGAVADVRLKIGATNTYAATTVRYRPMDMAISSWTFNNGLSNTITYDSDLRPTHILAVVDLTFSYDLANHITHITNRWDASLTQSIGYDAMGRITTIASGVDNESFTYDANGNRTHKVLNGRQIGITIAPDSNRLLVSTNVTYGHNADGNVTTANTTTLFHYGPFGRVDVGNGTWVYSVGAEGQRLREGGPATTYFAPDRGGVLLAENLSAIWQDYVYLNGRLVSVVKAGQVYSAHNDQTGRTLALTNPGRAFVWKVGGLPFTTTPMVNTFGAFNFVFPGQYEAHGHTHNGYREYNGYLGRYEQSDPIGLAGGINTYVYADNNPISRIDPLGLWSFSFGAYLGFGGAITFGQDPTTGQFFYGGRVGVGVGVGGSVDPNGKRPGAGQDGDDCNHGTTLGVFNEAGFTAGVIGGNITQADVGLDLDNPGHGYLDPPAPSDHLSFNRFGFSLGFSTGIEVFGH